MWWVHLYNRFVIRLVCLQKWIKKNKKFDPEGAGRISTEDFLLAIDSDDFRYDPKVAKKRAALKLKVLEYGTSFITLEEFVIIVSRHWIFGDYHNWERASGQANDCDVTLSRPTAAMKYVRVNHHS